MKTLFNQRVWLVWAKKSEPTSALTGQRKGWQQNLSTFAEAKQYCLDNPGYKVGIMFNKDCGHIGLDFDSAISPFGMVSKWAQPYHAMAKEQGAFMEKSVSGTGFKIIVKTDQPIQRGTFMQDGDQIGDHKPQIEVFNTKYFALVSDPEELERASTATWGPQEVERVERMLGHSITASPQADTPLPQKSGEVSPEKLKRALSLLDPKNYSDRESWIRLMSIAHHATGGSVEGLNVFDEWSAGDPDNYTDGYAESQWRTLNSDHPNALTFGSLIKEMSDRQRAEFYSVDTMEAHFPTLTQTEPAMDEAWTDQHVRDLFYEDHKNVLMRTAESKQWYAYNGIRWEPRDAVSVSGAVMDYLRRSNLETLPGADSRDGQRAIARLQMAKGIGAITSLVKGDSRWTVKEEDLDNQPIKLNTPNGTLCLQTGKMGPHDPTHRITSVTGADYIDGAKCDLWVRVLNDVFAGDKSMIRYVQQLLGYSLLGYNTEEICPIAWGHGCNGKSTITDTIRAMMGTYSCIVSSDLVDDRKNLHPTHVAALVGKRFAMCDEMGQNLNLSEATIKRISSTDAMTARKMYGNPFDFAPSHLIWMSTNHIPTIKGSDDGIWRRVRLIPFKVNLWDKRDPYIKEKLLAELPGILSWCLEGLRDFHANGFVEPEAVRVATEEYREEEDDFGSWWDENMEKTKDEMQYVSVSNFVSLYNSRHQDQLTSVRRACRMLREHGIETKRLKLMERRDETVIFNFKLRAKTLNQ